MPPAQHVRGWARTPNALADSFDRRRLIAVQVLQVFVGAALTVLTALGEMPPALLMTFTFALGCGATITIPAWQALGPRPRAVDLPDRVHG
jgi:hypothetical protein